VAIYQRYIKWGILIRLNVTENYRWNILFITTFCMLAVAIVCQCIPPILGILIDNLRITYAQAGSLMGLFMLPSIFLSIPGGLLLDRFGSKNVGTIAILILIIGIGINLTSESYFLFGFGRLIAGVGGAALSIVIPKVIASWFHDRELGLSMGVFNTAFPLGTILSLNFMGIIAHRFNWKIPMWIGFAFGLIALFLFLFFYRSRKKDQELSIKHVPLYRVLKEAGVRIWLLGLSWALFDGALMSFCTYAPNYFESQGLDISRAGLISSFPMWGSIFLAPFAGYLMDRFQRKWLFVVTGCGCIAILLLLIPKLLNHVVMLSILIGIFTAVIPTAIFAYTPDILPERMMGFGFGVLGTSIGIGISLSTYIVGVLRDITGNYMLSFTMMAILSLMAIFPMVVLRLKE